MQFLNWNWCNHKNIQSYQIIKDKRDGDEYNMRGKHLFMSQKCKLKATGIK